MYARTLSVALYGVETLQIEIQCQLTNDQPGFQIVGLGSKSISEAKERVKAAINSLGIALPCQRIIINLAPSALIKEGSHYDLPIILAILAAMKIIRQSDIEHRIFAGEISLNAEVKPTSGILPIAIYSVKAEKEFFCPIENYEEAFFSGNQKIFAISNILQLMKFFKGEAKIINPPITKDISNIDHKVDFSEISGHEIAKRALKIAASGKHNLLMIGPPGCGKTMLAERFTTILADPSINEILENSMIYSIAGKLPKGLKKDIPYRSPHHTASNAAIIGGGKNSKPGEISLSHNGVLFLDELPEFNQATLDSLRQPIESGEITISRADKIVNYPARFQLIAAMNPCKCGNFFEDNNNCSKVPFCAKSYMQKISGPILDRFDIIIKLSYQKISIKNDANENNETSMQIKSHITQSQKLQIKRLKKFNIRTNSQMTSKIIQQIYSENETVNNFITKLNEKKFTSRSIFKIIKLAQTIADLENDELIQKQHLFEALNYKNFIIN
ncbi:MAG: YifB family Mg chelatase-like AAA ATPase [Rickettsiales bacterium]|jgi:magnesium chelatase family protein|nr:YifB family Mg chelatase-like AAA ATPase [Rickettsiales bacterium]